MEKSQLIEELLSLKFLCLDDDEEDKKVHSIFENNSYFITRVFSDCMNFISLRTKRQLDVYLSTRQYDDFHLFAHYALIDNIVSWLLGAKRVNIKGCIESTLICANNKKLVESLYSLIDEQQIAA